MAQDSTNFPGFIRVGGIFAGGPYVCPPLSSTLARLLRGGFKCLIIANVKRHGFPVTIAKNAERAIIPYC